MAKLLVADDEQDIVELIKRFGQIYGHTVFSAINGQQAIDICHKEDIDVALLDIMMPDMDGFEVTKRIKEYKDIPIIIVSALGQEYDKLVGFQLGIDDYVVKPFSPKELMARVNVVASRHQRVTNQDSILHLKGIEINPLSREVNIDGNVVDLTNKEYELLVYFAMNKNIVLTRQQILNTIWGYEYSDYDRTVDWQIKLLRNKLGKYRHYIHTMRGVGYKFDDTE